EFVRPNPQKNIKGGVVEREGEIPVNKVMYYCKECEQGVRIGYKVSGDGKQRVCKKCQVVLD
ncbi:MAG TPA: 50S ribosomal protein L24, partial [Candidatus Aminicenantes bacterium]|nr:50S ribosomal protein L24 [Candidatus Aminicenantes bacterium]